jgi:hypothetical protein
VRDEMAIHVDQPVALRVARLFDVAGAAPLVDVAIGQAVRAFVLNDRPVFIEAAAVLAAAGMRARLDAYGEFDRDRCDFPRRNLRLVYMADRFRVSTSTMAVRPAVFLLPEGAHVATK